MFITFEGVDGSGKTTALRQIYNFLVDLKVDCILTREPGGSNSKEAEQIRHIILNKNSHLTDMTEAILYAADRRINLETTIWPALRSNKIVLCDRYVDSSLAYQGFGRQLGYERIKILQDLITDNTYPDLTIFFDLPPEEGLKRVEKRAPVDRLEKTDAEFKQRVYQGYKELIKIFPQRFVVIDALKPQEEVIKKIKNIILEKISLR